MIKVGMILLLRKLRNRWIQGGIFLLALSVSYILLVNGIFYNDWSLLGFSIAIIVALHLGEQPLISKSELKLHKILGASDTSILPLVISQSTVKTVLISLISLALSGISRLDNILPINSLFELSNLWILPFVISLFLLMLGVLHFRLFTKTNAAFSVK